MQPEVENVSKKIIIPIFIISILLIILIVILLFINRKTSILPKAKEINVTSTVSMANSYVFASPVRAKANGDLIRITVFILDNRGMGIFDKKVSIREVDGLIIKDIQSLTDEVGKAIFDVGSAQEGIFHLEIEVSGIILPQKAKVVYD